MTYNILSTGSKGNAVIINDEILIDCGVPFKLLEPHLAALKLVLLTHVHSDHFRRITARRLHKERPKLRFGCCEWMVQPLVDAGVDKRAIDVYEGVCENGLFYPEGGLLVVPQPLLHSVPNCGYRLSWLRGEFLFYATDAGTLDGIEAKNYDLYMIEANHTVAELEARAAAKLAAGEFSYEAQAAANHLSREQAEAWLAENMGPNSKYVFLHQHEEKERSPDA